MSPPAQSARPSFWLRRRICACRVLLGGLRRWGPLTLREMADECRADFDLEPETEEHHAFWPSRRRK